MLKQKMTYCCFREGSDDIVGINIVYILSKDDDFYSQGMRNVSPSSRGKVFKKPVYFMQTFLSFS